MNNYVIISGSSRENSQSSRLSHIINTMIAAVDVDAHTDVIDLAETRHQEWNNAFWEKEIPCSNWKKTSHKLAESSAVIFVVPEWHGMVPPALMNLLVLAERNELAHKPALIVSISGGSGGANPVAQLKGFCAKNNRICFIPDHVIVRNVRSKSFNGNEDSAGDEARLSYALSVLKAYIPGLDQVRQSGVLDFETWPYGM
ncbi:NADPH-dependent FMN reductase [Serratia sp. L9]|uniref:NADPH-dependent FMN reductase n=1 Tax=Serratia sp. L9 TaxID=3423946 RepID=UPI003D679718